MERSLAPRFLIVNSMNISSIITSVVQDFDNYWMKVRAFGRSDRFQNKLHNYPHFWVFQNDDPSVHAEKKLLKDLCRCIDGWFPSKCALGAMLGHLHPSCTSATHYEASGSVHDTRESMTIIGRAWCPLRSHFSQSHYCPLCFCCLWTKEKR